MMFGEAGRGGERVKTWQKLGLGRAARWGSHLRHALHSSVTRFMALLQC